MKHSRSPRVHRGGFYYYLTICQSYANVPPNINVPKKQNMANKRSGKYDHSVVDGFKNWAKEKQAWERGTDYNITPRFDPKTGKIKVILLEPLSEGVKEVLQKNPKILMKYSGVVDVDVADDGVLFIRFKEKGPGGRKRASSTKKEAGVRKKRVNRKVTHAKLAKSGGKRKRLPELQLPRNTSEKPHVMLLIKFLNSDLFSSSQRAECVSVIGQFANGANSDKRCEQLRKRLEGMIIIDPKQNKKLSADVIKILQRHSVKL